MDIAIAIWQINPAYEYLLTEDNTAIAEWRTPGVAQPTPEELAAAWATYQANQAAAQQAAQQADAQRAADQQAVLAGLTALGQPNAAAALARLLNPPAPAPAPAQGLQG